MRESRKISKYMLILLLPLGWALAYFSSSSPSAVESIYTKAIYKPFSQALSSATGIIPISLGEIIVLTLVILCLTVIIRSVVRASKQKRNRISVLLSAILNILIGASIIYFTFILIWGLNYHRLPFSSIAWLDTGKASVEELKSLCQYLIDQANDLREGVKEDENGVFKIEGGAEDVFSRASLGFDIASSLYPELGGSYGKPKPVILSELMCYTGITGVYFPFTGEANVNIKVPHSSLPSTACHEMAHQRGFAREDEANYIAYLTCSLHPDVDFKYSGFLLALINSMNALYRHNRESYFKLQERYSEGLSRDLNYINEFWEKYEGPVEKISTDINNAYLKSNLQEDGVYSYGRMVDLLIAEHRARTAGTH